MIQIFIIVVANRKKISEGRDVYKNSFACIYDRWVVLAPLWFKKSIYIYDQTPYNFPHIFQRFIGLAGSPLKLHGFLITHRMPLSICFWDWKHWKNDIGRKSINSLLYLVSSLVCHFHPRICQSRWVESWAPTQPPPTLHVRLRFQGNYDGEYDGENIKWKFL